ncbi:unnamed protein product [Cylindrotheca closterium]|uniref:WD40 repeat-like protein n=1 Tax=Cylindrotheca closterium TaxID=2856 RepID=A0AAD2FYW2_9STRA|nr:unnamed protein product [Cylindrotheca closterium]
MTDQQSPLISEYTKKVPIHVLGEGIGQYLCRTTFNNLRLTCKDVLQITESMIRPWPHKSLLVGKTSIQSIAFSPDGSKLCCRDRSGNIHVWDRTIGNEKTWRGSLRSACLGNIVCSPDNRFLAFDGKSKSIQVCSIQDGESLKSLQGHHGAITSISFHADGRTLASGSTDSTIRLWDLGTGKCQRIMRKHRGFVYSVTFSPDGQRLASGGSDRMIRIWNPFAAASHQQDDTIMMRGHSLVVVSLSFSPTNSNLLASGSLDGTLRLWDVLNQSCLKCIQHGSEILTVCFAPSGIRLAAGRSDETIVLWNVEEEKEEAEFNGRLLSFAPDGVTLATAGRDGIVKLQSI